MRRQIRRPSKRSFLCGSSSSSSSYFNNSSTNNSEDDTSDSNMSIQEEESKNTNNKKTITTTKEKPSILLILPVIIKPNSHIRKITRIRRLVWSHVKNRSTTEKLKIQDEVRNLLLKEYSDTKGLDKLCNMIGSEKSTNLDSIISHLCTKIQELSPIDS